MDLSREIVKQFATITNDSGGTTPDNTIFGTVVKYNDELYAQIDGSGTLTPISATANIKPGDRVIVTLKNHEATVTGNLSDPSASGTAVNEIGTKVATFDAIIADKASIGELNVERARIDDLEVDYVTVNGKLSAQEAAIGELEANDVTVNGKLEANKADIDTLKSDYVTVNQKLNANEADIDILKADVASIENLKADKADIESLDTKYANIDFTNIGKASMEYFYSQSGLIENVVVGDHTITGKLVGVELNANLIKTGSLMADRLVIKGEDGLYYKLNIEAGAVASEEVTDEQLQNGLHGDNIIAHTIAAEKVNVSDLVAFDATIGGLKISNGSIYSIGKESATNTVRGIYIGADGQFALGDAYDYLRYFKDTDGSYKLAISAKSFSLSTGEDVETAITDAAKTATNFLTYDSTSGLQLGNKIGGSWKGYRTQIKSNMYNILNAAGTVLASYGEKLIELGKNATDAVIKLCGGKGKISYVSDDYDYLQMDSNYVRLKGDTMASVYAVSDPANTVYKSAVNVSRSSVNIYSQKGDLISGDPSQNYEFYTAEINVTPEDTLIKAVAAINVFAGLDLTMYSSAGNVNITGANSLNLSSTNTVNINATLGNIELNPGKGFVRSNNKMFVTTANKTGYNDGKTGWYIGPDGTAHISHETSGPYLGFHFKNSTSATSSIQETSAGVITINNMRFGVNKVLWSGGFYMQASHTIALSEAISKQTNGIVLVFSQYMAGETNPIKNYGWSFAFVPKHAINFVGSGGSCFHMSNNASLDYFCSKYLYFSDTTIKGHDDNVQTGTSTCGITYTNTRFVLRYVIGV